MSELDCSYRSVMRLVAVVLSCAFADGLFAATPTPPLPELDEVEVTAGMPWWPLEDYLELPRVDSVAISPRGTYLALGWVEANFQRRLNVIEIPSMKRISTGLLQVNLGLTDVRWLDEERLLLQPDWTLLGLRRLSMPVGTVLVTTVGGRTLHELSPTPLGIVDPFERHRRLERASRGISQGPDASGPIRVVTARPDKSDRLLLQTLWSGQGSRTSGYGIFQLDLKSGKQTRVATLPLRGGHVIIGADRLPALVTGVNHVGEEVVYYLPEEARATGTDWKLLVNSGSGKRGLRPMAWTGEGEEYYALDGRTLPTRAVVVWNARDNTLRLLYSHPDVDMDEVRLDPAGKPWIFSGVSHQPVYWYPDPAHPLAQLHRVLTLKHAAEHVDIMSATDDLSTAVVRISSGMRPTTFLVVDVKSATSITGMETYPKLRGRRLSTVEPIEFRARDGLSIRAHLTTPLGSDGKPGAGLPLLVIAHSGPRGEVVDGRYDVERQLFASRGYAVLEVNARGSVGRGAAFEHAGEGKWGREVQDDFADAVRWAIKDGVAAAGRTCFYGSGYGAYSAMIAAAREPDLFQCVIGVAGVYDLPRMVQTMEPSGEPGRIPEYRAASEELTLQRSELRESGVRETRAEAEKRTSDIADNLSSWLNAVGGAGNPPSPPDEADWFEMQFLLQRAFGGTEELLERSPISHASSISAKVLLLHQHLDKDVPWEQAQAMSSALRSAGNSAQFASIGTENEGYFTPATRTDAYWRILRFLEQHIGSEP